MNKTAYTYDDVSLVPKYSDIPTRSQIKLTTKISRNYHLMVPYVASPMDTVCESLMAKRMMQLGGAGCIHRFMTIEEQAAQVKDVFEFSKNEDVRKIWTHEIPVMAAIGANGDYMQRAHALIDSGANVLLIDVAHGHHIHVKNALESLIYYRQQNKCNVDFIAGNVATKEGARDLILWGADGIRCGIGGGALCSTRVQTGHGIPNVTSLEQCLTAVADSGKSFDIPIMADGGIRSSGDIAKAIAAGASCVMLGSLLAGTEESPGAIVDKKELGLFKRYRGSASMETKMAHGMMAVNVEGESTMVPFKGGVKFVIESLNDGLRSALSYSGCRSVEEFFYESDYVYITSAGMQEGKPHLIK